MSNISSNALFHFTPKAEYLVGILTNNFVPRYCLEEIPLSSKDNITRPKLLGGIPMVCFCDIPLGQIKNHINTYGKYGIGMTKKWALKNNLNPILYVNEDTQMALCISNLAETIVNLEFSEPIKSLPENFHKITNYIKPYKGDFRRGDQILKDVRFYNEREWRFVPNTFEDDSISLVLTKKDFENAIKLSQENSKLSKFPLEFTPDDVKYIFVDKADEVYPMILAIREIKSKFNSEEIDILTSKILTTEQVMEDF